MSRMARNVILTLLLLPVIFALALAQAEKPKTDQEREAICRRVPCRPKKTLKLKVSQTETAEFDFPKGPYVADGTINVLAGEEVNVEFDDGADGLTNARYVKKITAPEKTMTFKLAQTDDGTILTIKNPFPKNILYDCLIQRYKAQGLQKTSIIPALSGLISLEKWPYPVTQVVIRNVRYVSSK